MRFLPCLTAGVPSLNLMKKYFLRRLLLLIPLLFGISILSFGLISLSPSDPAEVSIRVNAMVPTLELIDLTRKELGLDKPAPVRYFNWLKNAVQGDLGKSYVSGRDVAGDILEAAPATLWLALSALTVILLLCVPLGILCALKENKFADKFVRGLIFFASSFPGFWAGLLLMWLFAVKFNWLPTSGMRSPSSVILPALTLSISYFSTYLRLIRSEMIKTSKENWVKFARARCLPDRFIIRRILLNSLRGTASGLGMSIPKLMAGAFVVENIFAWPGLGRLCVTAIFNRDFPVIQAYIVIMACLFILFNLASDLFVAWLDPRERKDLEG